MLFALVPLLVFGQENNAFEKRWEEINNGIEYKRSARPQGPEKEYISPQNFDEKSRGNTFYEEEPSNDDIIYSREKRYEGGENDGIRKHIKKDKSRNLDDISTPKTDAPKRQRSNSNRNLGDGTMFKYVFIMIAILLVVFLIYHFFFKNPVKSDKQMETLFYDKVEEINPETILKSQLQTDLEKAVNAENYRAAVRIYYISILKSLIERNWIKWAKRKTNTHYLIEMSTKEEYASFNKAVQIYEWTWYGKNELNKEVFERFAVFYDDFLKRLKDE